MSTVAEHLDQWQHNRQFLSDISPSYPDWMVTVVFYVALHAVDAVLAFDKMSRINSHEGRNVALQTTNRYEKLWNCYHPLYNISRTVRYSAKPELYVPFDRVDKQVIRKYLYPLEKSVGNLMKKSLDASDIKLRAS